MRAVGIKESDGKVPAEGTSLHYVTMGQGPPLVVVHGGPGLGHSYLRPGLDELADRFRVIYYDQRGSGRSEVGDASELTLSGAIEDLEALREGLGLDRISILGHSFGADAAVIYAALYPSRVASLILANPGPPFDPEQQETLWTEMRRRMRAEDAATMEEIQASPDFEQLDPKTLERFITTMYLPFFRDRSSADRLNLGFTDISARNILGIEERWMEEFESLDAIGRTAAVKAPTLVVHGELEPIPVEFSRFLAETIPSGRLEVIEGANHFTYLEDPEPFFAAVGEFLAEAAE